MQSRNRNCRSPAWSLAAALELGCPRYRVSLNFGKEHAKLCVTKLFYEIHIVRWILGAVR